MTKSAIVFVVLFILIAGSSVFSTTTSSDPAELSSIEKQMTTKVTVMKNVTSMPMTFTENRGQWDERVLYRADAGHAVAWFTTEGVTYQFSRPLDGQNIFGPLERNDDPQAKEIEFEHLTLKTALVAANQHPTVTSDNQIDYKCNYFYGNDPSGWRTNVPNYEVITYEEVYPGIDLKYYGNRKHMEYDFVVSPGADPSQIQIHYDGVKSMSVDDKGQLVLETEWGPVTELTPVVYQMNGSERIALSGEYVIWGENSFGFKLSENYNPELALVIDPEIGYSTYLGGTSYDYSYNVCIADDGAGILSGVTGSTDFPTTAGAFSETHNTYTDLFVTKFTPDGDALEYSTYIGGNSDEWTYDMHLGSDGSAYLTGYTYSSDFPVTAGAIDESYSSYADVFVVRLSDAGDSLIYGTYLGGTNYDYGYGIYALSDGSAILSGYTSSNDFPVVAAYDESHNGDYDVYLAKFSPEGDSIIFSTYFGGNDGDYGRGVTVDDLGRITIAGTTYSTDFPTYNAYDSTANGSYYNDLFVSQFSPNADTLLYSTYIGESGYSWVYRVHKFKPGISDNRYVYFTGYAESGFPTTPDAYDRTGNGYSDVAIVKVSPSTGGANSLVYSSFFGGNDSDYGYGIEVDKNGSIYLGGHTYSANLPMVNSIDNTFSTSPDAFVAKIVPGAGTAGLVFSSYIGGNNSDYGRCLKIDEENTFYLAGYTYSTDFPTAGPGDVTINGGADGYMTKITLFTADNVDIAVGTNNGEYSSIEVAYSGATGAVTGVIYYRLGGEISYTSGAFTPGNDTLSYTFPAGLTATRALEYYLELLDGSYTERVGGTVKPIAYTPLLTNVQSQRPDTTEARRYKMIGVPLALSGDSACSAVFPDDLGGGYKSNWRLASYDPEEQAYAEYPNSAPVKPGQGYWLITRSSADYGAPGRAVQPNRLYFSNYFYEVSMDSGWNLIANPFPFEVSATEVLIDTGGVVVSGWPTAILDPAAYWYSGTGYIAVTSIPGWDAVFVNVKRDGVKALFPYHRAGAAKKAVPLANSYPLETGSSDWQVQIKMSAGGYIDDGNFIGVRSDALVGLDRYDYGEPPPPPDGPSLALKTDETDRYLKRCDYRPPFDDGAEWYLTFTEIEDRIVTVSGIEKIPNDMDAWLVLDDKSKMRLEEGSTINLPDDVVSARLIIGDESYLRNNESIITPNVFALEQNYPNPFNPMTTIQYTLPEPATVRLEVYNLLGQRVVTLVDKELPAGDYTTVWEGTDNAGRPVASGIYLYKIDAGKFTSAKKMILLK